MVKLDEGLKAIKCWQLRARSSIQALRIEATVKIRTVIKVCVSAGLVGENKSRGNDKHRRNSRRVVIVKVDVSAGLE